MHDRLVTRRNAILAELSCGAGLCAVGWLLFGPLWAIGGLVAGLLAPMLAYATYTGLFLPQPVTLVARGRHQDALRILRRYEREVRQMAVALPSQFRDHLARHLAVQAYALHKLHEDDQALQCADECVAIYQALAAERPAKYAPELSGAVGTRSCVLAALDRQAEAAAAIEPAIRMYRNLAISQSGKYLPRLAEALTDMAEWLADIGKNPQALTAAHEATGIYWHKLPGPGLPAAAARAALLEGRLLCQQADHHGAVKLLARGWTLAQSQQQEDALAAAASALEAAYHADPGDFTVVWHAETGSEPPSWLNR